MWDALCRITKYVRSMQQSGRLPASCPASQPAGGVDSCGNGCPAHFYVLATSELNGERGVNNVFTAPYIYTHPQLPTRLIRALSCKRSCRLHSRDLWLPGPVVQLCLRRREQVTLPLSYAVTSTTPGVSDVSSEYSAHSSQEFDPAVQLYCLLIGFLLGNKESGVLGRTAVTCIL